MNKLLVIAFLFFAGCLTGWCIEVVYRRFSPQNKSKRWINPGFLIGPYLPLYGFGLCIMYLLASAEPYLKIGNPVWSKIVFFIVMTVSLTALEYIAGIIFIKRMHVKLWDYSSRLFNYQGIICPAFTLIWGILGVCYCLFIHPEILSALDWLSRNLAFSFFIGLFFGVFIIDVCYSIKIVTRIKAYAEENDILVRYEALKEHVSQVTEERKEKYKFIFAFHSPTGMPEYFKNYAEKERRRTEELKEKIRLLEEKRAAKKRN